MTSEIVRQGRAAWGRLKKGNGDWADWILVGAALLEGRKIAMRNARTDRPSGTGYVQALQSWQLTNRLDLRPLERNDLFKVMAILPDIEAWRATLPPARGGRASAARPRCCTTIGKRPGRPWSVSPRHPKLIFDKHGAKQGSVA